MNNYIVTVDDVNREEIVYLPPFPYLQEHMVRRKPQIHDKINKISLSPMVAQYHPNIVMFMDLFLCK